MRRRHAQNPRIAAQEVASFGENTVYLWYSEQMFTVKKNHKQEWNMCSRYTIVTEAKALEDRFHPVVIGLRDWVELVIVAAGAVSG